MSFVNTCAGNLRLAIADLETLTHDRTKERHNQLRAAILRRLAQTADMLEGQFEIVTEEPQKPAPKKRAPRTRREGNVVTIDFKSAARAKAESVFKK